jgi:hypothetical protein
MQTMSPNTPEAVLLHALELMNAMDYAGVVDLCDADSMRACLDEYRERMQPPTEQDVRDRYPHLAADERPRWLAALLKDHERKAGQIPRTLGRGITYERLLDLTPDAFLRRLLEGQDFRGSTARRLRERGIAPPPILAMPLSGFRHEVLSAVPTGPSEVCVSYRVAIDGDDPATRDLEYEDLRRAPDGQWRLVARQELLQPRGSVSRMIELPPDIAALLRDDA